MQRIRSGHTGHYGLGTRREGRHLDRPGRPTWRLGRAVEPAGEGERVDIQPAGEQGIAWEISHRRLLYTITQSITSPTISGTSRYKRQTQHTTDVSTHSHSPSYTPTYIILSRHTAASLHRKERTYKAFHGIHTYTGRMVPTFSWFSSKKARDLAKRSDYIYYDSVSTMLQYLERGFSVGASPRSVDIPPFFT